MKGNVLNLDSYIKAPAEVSLQGKTYVLKAPTLEQWVTIRQLSKQMLEADTPQAEFDNMLAMVRVYMPDMPQEVLDSLSLPQLTALQNFVNDYISEQDAPFASEDEGEKIQEDAEGN